MSLKKLLSVVLGLALLGASAAWAVDSAEEEAWKKEPAYGQEIRIGYPGSLCTGSLGIAQLKGFYAAEGLKTRVVRVGLSGNEYANAIGTGKVEVGCGHIAAMMVPAVNGVRITFTTGIHTGCKSLYVLGKSDIKSLKDLEGKYIAIHDGGFGGSDHNIALRFLIRDSVDPQKVKWKVTDAGAAVLAMQGGELHAALLSDQFAWKFVQDGTLRSIRSLTYDPDFNSEACCIYAISSEFAEKNPITAKKLTRAHEAASAWVMEHPEETVKTLQGNNWASGKYDLVLAMLKTYDYSISDKATEETLRKVINDYKTLGIIDKTKDTEETLKCIWDPLASK